MNAGRAPTYGARFVLLGGPAALAFFSGGYFDQPRAWAGLVAWALVAVAAVTQTRALPRTSSSWLALGGLALLAAWTLASIAWAPIAGSAYHAGQLAVLYAGALLAAALLLRTPGAQRLVEPTLAAGALVVIGYGLSERLLPGALQFARSVTAQGRLEQPLTYWNAMGELAALGFVLVARIAGDSGRAAATRALAAAASAPLGMGLYLSFSRGALFACAAGLAALIGAAPRREQLQAIVVAAGAGVLAAAAAAPFGGVTSLTGSLATRERQGAATLAALVAVATATGLLALVLARRRRTGSLALGHRAPLIALVAICAGLALVILAGTEVKGGRPLGAGASRLTTLASDRSDFWGVAVRAFAHEPLRGVGAGGWAVWWLRHRSVDGFAQDAHSLPLQTAAELGLIGVAALAACFAGIGLAARRVHRAAPALAAGPIGGVVVYGAHAPIDWDWQMPAVTLVAIVLAGALLAMAEASARSARAGVARE